MIFGSMVLDKIIYGVSLVREVLRLDFWGILISRERGIRRSGL